MIEGIDVYWKNEMNWPVSGKSFGLLKATEGIDYNHDAWLADAVKRVEDNGLRLGFYHVGRNTDSGTPLEQVDYFLQRVAKFADPTKVWLGLDFERFHYAPQMTQDQGKAWFVGLHQHALKGLLYASESAFYNAGQDGAWVAHYGVDWPGIPADIHQYDSTVYDHDHSKSSIVQLDALLLPGKEEDMTDAEVVAIIRRELGGYLSTDVIGDAAMGVFDVSRGVAEPRFPDRANYVKAFKWAQAAGMSGSVPPGTKVSISGSFTAEGTVE